MKKLVFSILTIFASVALKAQVFLIDDFVLSATEGAYGIYADIDCNSDEVLFLDMQAPNDQQQVQMKLWNYWGDVDKFINSLQSVKQYFPAWSKIAQENSITSFSKNIETTFTDKDIYFTENGKWYLEKGVDIKCKFMVSSDGSCYLVLQTDYMTSEEVVSHGYSVGPTYSLLSGRWGMTFASSSLSITRYCSGASLVFSSPEEIDMFIQKLIDAQQWKKRNIEQGKLFK